MIKKILVCDRCGKEVVRDQFRYNLVAWGKVRIIVSRMNRKPQRIDKERLLCVDCTDALVEMIADFLKDEDFSVNNIG